MDEWTDEWTDERVSEWVGGWLAGWMHGDTDVKVCIFIMNIYYLEFVDEKGMNP